MLAVCPAGPEDHLRDAADPAPSFRGRGVGKKGELSDQVLSTVTVDEAALATPVKIENLWMTEPHHLAKLGDALPTGDRRRSPDRCFRIRAEDVAWRRGGF